MMINTTQRGKDSRDDAVRAGVGTRAPRRMTRPSTMSIHSFERASP
jgi:hypothetical protein